LSETSVACGWHARKRIERVCSIKLEDSRRLTGPNILLDRAGAVLEIYGPDSEVESLVRTWRQEARKLLDAVGWLAEDIADRSFPGGASLALSAPIDALYAATEVNEKAVETAVARIEGRENQLINKFTRILVEEIARERTPQLLALREAAHEHDVAFISDDDLVSIGLGAGSLTFEVSDIPDPASIDWSKVKDIPLALITGTNGKSTTVRLLASMIRAAGLVEGFSSTDGIMVDGKLVEQGDYSGPEGARAILRNRDVEIAVLETARGGILRRGLPVSRTDVAMVTNVGKDHLGEYGVNDIETLLETKLVVHRAVDAGGFLVLNVDDPGLRSRGPGLGVKIAWFGLDPGRPDLVSHVKSGGEAAWLEKGALVWTREGRRENIINVDEIPLTLKGAARHNISNSLAAILVGGRLGLTLDKMARGLQAFTGTPEENPGRGNVFDLGGVMAIVDFAHNAHGFRSLFEMANALPVKRRLVILGQAGDRTDESILEQVAITWDARPDRIIIKEMEQYLRGREMGEVTGMIESKLRRLGASNDMMEHADSEMEAVHRSLEWARPGDLLLLLVYAEREETFVLLRRLEKENWKPGDKLPE
jgi:UDP-N-acetylmuramyl tripeptide synthase